MLHTVAMRRCDAPCRCDAPGDPCRRLATPPRADFDARRRALCRAAAPPAAVHQPARVLPPGATSWSHPAHAPMSVHGFGFVARRHAPGFDARRCCTPRAFPCLAHALAAPRACTLPRPPPCTTRAGFDAPVPRGFSFVARRRAPPPHGFRHPAPPAPRTGFDARRPSPSAHAPMSVRTCLCPTAPPQPWPASKIQGMGHP
ncbi:hypothetical protein GGX14DRAFT_579742 [Mycena pura]|uniref:Uncharacterized protein n=1 Tax=Mycena pura TaxID=153505 RepID=A0AAD6XYC3_9AGAR|nr:hypothetical protein GGX14DRAFT_579742 [Mycena pura]